MVRARLGTRSLSPFRQNNNHSITNPIFSLQYGALLRTLAVTGTGYDGSDYAWDFSVPYAGTKLDGTAVWRAFVSAPFCAKDVAICSCVHVEG